MPDPKLLARYGLKNNPFTSPIPFEGSWMPPGAEALSSSFSVEALVIACGIALVTGESGRRKGKFPPSHEATGLRPAYPSTDDAVFDVPVTSEEIHA